MHTFYIYKTDANVCISIRVTYNVFSSAHACDARTHERRACLYAWVPCILYAVQCIYTVPTIYKYAIYRPLRIYNIHIYITSAQGNGYTQRYQCIIVHVIYFIIRNLNHFVVICVKVIIIRDDVENQFRLV